MCKYERVLVLYSNNKNIFVLSDNKYNRIEKEEKNSEYSAKIGMSIKQFEEGKIVVKTMRELEVIVEWAWFFGKCILLLPIKTPWI